MCFYLQIFRFAKTSVTRLGGLYRGISSKLLQSVLTAAILFMSKERVFALTKRVLTGTQPAPARS